MSKTIVVMCDVCNEKLATRKCFACGCDLCESHDFGGKHSCLKISALIYNNFFLDEHYEADSVASVCSRCGDKLKSRPFKIPVSVIEDLATAFIDWKQSFSKESNQ